MSSNPSVPDRELEALIGCIGDEFADRIARGERPTVDEYAALHPQAADVLRQVLPAIELLGSLRHDESGSRLASPNEINGQLGDFRIIREIGRGGMGVVYEAEQISLSRRVALKVLPFAGALDPQHLVRFRNEALAAAQLHHTNIVPVYAVGNERGVQFYAMQFIAGRTLAQVIAEMAAETHHADGRSSVSVFAKHSLGQRDFSRVRTSRGFGS